MIGTKVVGTSLICRYCQIRFCKTHKLGSDQLTEYGKKTRIIMLLLALTSPLFDSYTLRLINQLIT